MRPRVERLIAYEIAKLDAADAPVIVDVVDSWECPDCGARDGEPASEVSSDT